MTGSLEIIRKIVEDFSRLLDGDRVMSLSPPFVEGELEGGGWWGGGAGSIEIGILMGKGWWVRVGW